MQSQHAGAIRGLGIAGIALSAISLLACLLGVVCLAAMSWVFSDPYMMDEIVYGLADPYGYGYYDYEYYADDFTDVLGFGAILVGALIVWEILTCVVSLIAGIITLRSANDSTKLNKIFGWTLAGAIAALLGGRFITMVVFIVAAVFATKDRGAAQNAYWQVHGSPVTVTPEGAAQRPAQQPVAQPAQPVQQQPVVTSVRPQPVSAYQQAYQQAYGQPLSVQPQVTQPIQPAQVTPVAQPVQPTEVVAEEAPVKPAEVAAVEEPAQSEQPAGDK